MVSRSPVSISVIIADFNISIVLSNLQGKLVFPAGIFSSFIGSVNTLSRRSQSALLLLYFVSVDVNPRLPPLSFK